MLLFVLLVGSIRWHDNIEQCKVLLRENEEVPFSNFLCMK